MSVRTAATTLARVAAPLVRFFVSFSHGRVLRSAFDPVGDFWHMFFPRRTDVPAFVFLSGPPLRGMAAGWMVKQSADRLKNAS